MPTPPYPNPQTPSLDSLLGQLTLDEKLSLLSGGDFWHTRAIERLGVPAVRMTDGPHGVTVSGDQSGPATCFPTATGMAATWNRDLIERVGQALGRETRARGNQVLLGPSVDLHRSPLNGRNYESYSEDPYLAGRLAAAYVRGVQSQGVGACIKHCTANNQQTEQTRTSSEVAERPLREIYLKPWELAIRECEPWGVMTSYNLLNGEYTSASRHLLTDLLKGELGFGGFIVSDWRGVHGPEAAPAGLDLEMPGPGKHLTAAGLQPLLDAGELTLSDLDDKVRRLLTLALRAAAPPPEGAPPQGALDAPEHRALAREVAAESMVLLKNDGGLLPLCDRTINTLAVIGPNACEARLGGGGSSSTTPFYAVGPMEGLLARCGRDVQITYAEGCSFRGQMPAVPAARLAPDRGDQRGLRAGYFDNPDLTGAPVLERLDPQLDFSWGWSSPGGDTPKDGYSVRWQGRLTAPTDGEYRLGLTWQDGGVRLYLDGELLVDAWQQPEEDNFEARYASRSQAVEMSLAAGQLVDLCVEYRKVGNKAALRLEWDEPRAIDPVVQACQAAAEADAAVVFAGLCNLYEGGNNDRQDIVLPAGQDALITAVAAANPRTVVVLVNGSPVAMEPWVGSVPAILEAWYPGQEGGHAIAAALFGDTNPSGRLPDTFPRRLEDNPSFGNYPGGNGSVRYEEGVFVGYRHYDRNGIEPLFPFGHGLSYTRFEYEGLSVTPRSVTGSAGETEPVEVRVQVANVGDLAGQEVVQVFVSAPEGAEPRPPRQLVGFAKVHLEPGQTAEVALPVQLRDLAWYDESRGWVVEPGEYGLAVAGCGESAPLTVSAGPEGAGR